MEKGVIKDIKKLINHPKLKPDTHHKLKLLFRADQEVKNSKLPELPEPISVFGAAEDSMMIEADSVRDNPYAQQMEFSPAADENVDFSPQVV